MAIKEKGVHQIVLPLQKTTDNLTRSWVIFLKCTQFITGEMNFFITCRNYERNENANQYRSFKIIIDWKMIVASNFDEYNNHIYPSEDIEYASI